MSEIRAPKSSYTRFSFHKSILLIITTIKFYFTVFIYKQEPGRLWSTSDRGTGAYSKSSGVTGAPPPFPTTGSFRNFLKMLKPTLSPSLHSASDTGRSHLSKWSQFP